VLQYLLRNPPSKPAVSREPVNKYLFDAPSCYCYIASQTLSGLLLQKKVSNRAAGRRRLRLLLRRASERTWSRSILTGQPPPRDPAVQSVVRPPWIRRCIAQRRQSSLFEHTPHSRGGQAKGNDDPRANTSLADVITPRCGLCSGSCRAAPLVLYFFDPVTGFVSSTVERKIL
jgi:hypothetical protein